MYFHPQSLIIISIFSLFGLQAYTAWSQALRSIQSSHPKESVGLDKYLITVDQIPMPNFGIVNSIIRDRRGFLWFGTTAGLCKYDGYQVRVFKNESSFSSFIEA